MQEQVLAASRRFWAAMEKAALSAGSLSDAP